MAEIEELARIIKRHYPQFTGIHEAANLFPWPSDEQYRELKGSIARDGLGVPVECTADRLLLDGRSRLMACHETQTEVRVETVDTPDPFAWSLMKNLMRRHLTHDQRASVGAEMREHYDAQAKARQLSGLKQYRATVPAAAPERNGDAREQVAKAVRVGQHAIDHATTVRRHAPDMHEKVKAGLVPLQQAYQQAKRTQAELDRAVREQRGEAPARQATQRVIVITHDGQTKEVPKPERSVFNRTNASVDWATWTWNPVTGCLHGCEFCYAREIAHGPKMAAHYPFKFEPAFYEHRLEAPRNTPLPTSGDPRDGRVFVGSMADLFGKWVPDVWIEKVFAACLQSPHWEYLFLTKWPRRYQMLASLPKAWFGASVIWQADVLRVERDMAAFATSGIKWVSLEPMLGPIRFHDLSWCNLMVIGSQTATQQPTGYVPAKPAHYDWVWDVVRQCREAGVPYYLKPNLAAEPGMEFPKGEPGNFKVATRPRIKRAEGTS